MFDQYQNAAAIARVERINKEQTKQAYEYMLASPEGRWFLSMLTNVCKLYDPVNCPEDEGSRRVAVMMRNTVADIGLLPKWQEAENEYCAYQKRLKEILEQTEAKED